MYRLSIREMLAGVALVALCTMSLKYANETWLAVVAGLAMLLFFGASIVAVVDRGPRQAFAIGFSLTVLAYGLTLLTGQTTSGFGGNVHSKNVELDPWEGRLPTTRMLRYAFQIVKVDEKAVIGYGGNRTMMGTVEVPAREVFMPIGHCWWALAAGYVGGCFARFVYLRRVKEGSPLAGESS